MVDVAAAQAPAALEIRIQGKRVTVDRRGFDVLGRIDVDVASREIVVVVGGSGAGKTSLLRAIAGLDKAFDGEIRTLGRPIHGPGRDRGMVFQEHRLMPWMTVAQNVAYALPSRQPADRVRGLVAHALALVGLTGFHEAWPNQLSGGMAQRASLARALVTTPEILLLDEPLGALDSLLRSQMQTELERIILAEQLTAMMVTHDVDEAVRLADRVLVMAGPPGRVVAEVPIPLPRPREVADPQLQDFRTRILAILHQGVAIGDLLVHPDAHRRALPVDHASGEGG